MANSSDYIPGVTNGFGSFSKSWVEAMAEEQRKFQGANTMGWYDGDLPTNSFPTLRNFFILVADFAKTGGGLSLGYDDRSDDIYIAIVYNEIITTITVSQSKWNTRGEEVITTIRQTLQTLMTQKKNKEANKK